MAYKIRNLSLCLPKGLTREGRQAVRDILIGIEGNIEEKGVEGRISNLISCRMMWCPNAQTLQMQGRIELR